MGYLDSRTGVERERQSPGGAQQSTAHGHGSAIPDPGVLVKGEYVVVENEERQFTVEPQIARVATAMRLFVAIDLPDDVLSGVWTAC